MKFLLVAAGLFSGGWAFAQSKGTVILDCNINAWPYQQFRVVQTFDGGMMLDQLTTEGRWVPTPISHMEWERGEFAMDKDSHGNQIVVSYRDGGWWYQSKGAAGLADCD